ncbi:sigma-70 family RNA polymerase sigma factor [Salinibacillus xinjiangensis]|uniref:sigma-70 family RNA polymerase sigma factor n=1 Tax=Salinibacillus xinjiangensis TaxID=1229268 RepID=UPI00129B063B|nr:sigma-70 family RNA polymerase sigma factor [Salinibacillus xinjiangensis]
MEERDVWLAQKGDKEAFTRLITECQDSLYRVAKGILRDDADCGDAIQEAIMKSYYSIHTLKDLGAFKAWITRILIHKCYDLLKKQKRVVPMESVELLAENRAELKQHYELFDEIAKLKEKHRTILILFYYEQYSIKEIADILKLREGTVKSRLNRARASLADLLKLDGIERRRKESGSQEN